MEEFVYWRIPQIFCIKHLLLLTYFSKVNNIFLFAFFVEYAIDSVENIFLYFYHYMYATEMNGSTKYRARECNTSLALRDLRRSVFS